MTRPRPRRWIVGLLAVSALTCAAVIGGAALVYAPPVLLPEPPAVRRPVEPEVVPPSDVHWDAEAAREFESLPAVPVTPGQEFRVSSELDDETVVAAVLAASQRAIPLTLRLLGEEPEPQRRPWDVQILRTRARVMSEARGTGWVPPASLLGFADLVHGRICLTSDDLDDPADVLALAGPGSALTMVAAHEAAHQVAARCIPGAGGDAAWLCEGLAQVIGEQVLLETTGGDECGAVPLLSGMMCTCRDLLAEGRLPTSTDIFNGHLDRFDLGTRYAIYWAFFHHLNDPSRRERLQQFVARLRAEPQHAAGWAGMVRLADSVWRVDERQELTAGFQRSVQAFAPRWRSAGRRFEVSGTTWTQVGGADSSTSAIRFDPVGRTEFVVRGTLEILPRGDEKAGICLAVTPSGRVQVDFVAGRGVGVWLLDGTEGHPPPAWFEPNVLLPAGRRTDFAVEVTRERVRVVVRGTRVLEWDPHGRDLTGAWGVSCGNFWKSESKSRSAAIWRDVRLE